MANNLRIVTNNVIDRATISASSTAGLLTVDNLKKPHKTLVHRASGTSVVYTVTLPAAEQIGMVSLAFTNLSPTATVEVGTWPSFLDTSVDPPVQRFATSGAQQAAQGNAGSWGFGNTPGVNSFAYGGGTYATVWFGNVSLSSFTITVNDPGNPQGYVEVGYIVAGHVWTPSRNASWGASASVQDMTKNERTDGGDLMSSRGPMYRKLTLPFNDFDPVDRAALWALIRYNGLSHPFFASLYPEDADKGREQAHQIFGKLTNLSAISNANYASYTTSLDIEEV